MPSRIDLPLRTVGAERWPARLLRACNTVTRLTLEHGQLHAGIGCGEPQPVDVADESRIGARLTLLKIRTRDARSRSHLVVLANFGPRLRNVIPDDFRRLRMWLRLGQTSRSHGSTT